MTETLPPIIETVLIERPIESVWRILTSDETAPHWLGCMRYTCELGHVFFMQQDREKAAREDISGATHCEILALEAPVLFKFSWFLPDYPATFVSFVLARAGEGQTQVTFTHEGWEQYPADQIKPIHDMLSGGWKSFVLPNLKRVAES